MQGTVSEESKPELRARIATVVLDSMALPLGARHCLFKGNRSGRLHSNRRGLVSNDHFQNLRSDKSISGSARNAGSTEVCATPFDCVENAEAYIGLLIEAIAEAKREIEVDVGIACEVRAERHLQALRLVRYKLYLLGQHLKISRRMLNDLIKLRRPLLEDEPDLTRRAAPASDR